MDEKLRVRAYHMFLQGYGKDDNDRYFMALDLCNKMNNEKCQELVITPEMHTCMFCDTRYGSIMTPYLPTNILVCWWCFLNNSKNKLMEQYTDSYDNTQDLYIEDIEINDEFETTFESDMNDDTSDNVKDTVKDKLIDGRDEQIKKYSSGFNRLFRYMLT